LEQAAILTTALTAAIAAFASVIPGRHRKICLLPLAPLAVWLASLGEGCASDWLRFGADGLQVRPDWECAPAAIFIGIIPAVVMIVMLRRGTWKFRVADLSHRRRQRHGPDLALRRSRSDLGASRSDWVSCFKLAFRDCILCTEELLGNKVHCCCPAPCFAVSSRTCTVRSSICRCFMRGRAHKGRSPTDTFL
jgi:hypothetical protein